MDTNQGAPITRRQAAWAQGELGRLDEALSWKSGTIRTDPSGAMMLITDLEQRWWRTARQMVIDYLARGVAEASAPS